MKYDLNRRHLLLSCFAGALMPAACRASFESQHALDDDVTIGTEPLLRAVVSERTYNAHAHILAGSWWAPRGSNPDDYMKQMSATARRNQMAVARQLSGSSEDEINQYKTRAKSRAELWTYEEAADHYIKRMDHAGIDTVFNLTMDNLPIGGGGVASFTKEFMRIVEDDYSARQKFPDRIVSFAGVDPRRGKEAVSLFEIAITDYGFAGYGEMIGSLWDVSPADRDLMYPIWEKAVDLKVPVIIDATQNKGRSKPDDFDRLARDFPALKICMAGGGAGMPEIETDGIMRPAPETFLELCETHENLYMDLGDWQGIASGRPPYRRNDGSAEYAIKFLRRALDGPAGNKVMFGTDFPIFANLYSEKDWTMKLLETAQVLDTPFSTSDWTRFFSRNAAGFITA